LPGETEQDADQRLQSFMRDAVPQLAQFLPANNAAPSHSMSSQPQRQQS